MYENVSVTHLTHHPLAALDPSPFHDLCATDYQGGCEFYSYDVFRRLYNDAVESMLHYKHIAETNCQEINVLHAHCHELECCLMELADVDDQ